MIAYGSDTAVLAIAHRGGAALSLENTLEACARSYALGFRYLEVDVRLSADGVPMLFHDASLLRLAGRRRDLGTLTAAELSDVVLRDGQHIATLAEAMVRFRDAYFAIDVKESGAVPAVLAVVRELDATDRVCLTGGWDSSLRRGRDILAPGIATSLGWRGSSAVVATGRARLGTPWWRSGAAFAHVPLHLGPVPTYGPAVIERAHRLGMRLIVWGSRTSAQMHRLLDDGADGIITDHPDVLREVLIARGRWSRPIPRSRDTQVRTKVSALG